MEVSLKVVIHQIPIPLFVLDFGLDIVNSVRGFNLESYGFSCKAERI